MVMTVLESTKTGIYYSTLLKLPNFDMYNGKIFHIMRFVCLN